MKAMHSFLLFFMYLFHFWLTWNSNSFKVCFKQDMLKSSYVNCEIAILFYTHINIYIIYIHIYVYPRGVSHLAGLCCPSDCENVIVLGPNESGGEQNGNWQQCRRLLPLPLLTCHLINRTTTTLIQGPQQWKESWPQSAPHLLLGPRSWNFGLLPICAWAQNALALKN